MKFIDLQKTDRWVEKKLSYPGFSDDELALRKAYWLASLVCAVVIIVLTLSFKLINPDLKVLFAYGCFVGFLFAEWVVELLIFHYNIERRMFINQVIFSLVTFVAILMLGGIPSSGGLIFAGFFVVLFSLDFKNRRYSLWLFVIYLITVILAGVLDPYLSVPPEMTRGVNISLYVINLLWISSLSLLFVLNFIKERVKIEQREADRLKELDQVKTKLYSNITHEFRTPITVILGMAELIREKPGEWVDEGTLKIEQNGRILLKQVSQMLDLAKLESSSMPLHMVNGDIILYFSNILELFRATAEAKCIGLSYSPAVEHFTMDHDPDMLQQVLSNLLSNALKYTGRGGYVELSVSPLRGGNALEVRVRDNGMGIPTDELPHIFERFYRVDQGNEQSIEGSGLGLALTRELVKLLGGTISVKSEEGEGALFCFILPVTNNAPVQKRKYIPGLKDKESTSQVHHKPITSPEKQDERVRPGTGLKEIPLLLLVEDNPDVVFYLRTILDLHYRVIIAIDGKEGYESALTHIPDIILSDVMMPQMDGIEMLVHLKKDVRTSHIPVVVLTAKADIHSRLEGLERGAEAYMAKPFNSEELLIRLRMLIDLRKKLHKRYSGPAGLDLQDEKEYQIEDAFIHKVREVMAQNLDDDEFDILRLSQAMSMSRAQLYRKFSTLTNRTIGEYLRSFRLNKARELLEAGGSNVSEAAYSTGFRNLSHFSRVFTNEFGMNPSEVLNSSHGRS